jgi:Fe2+ or Zn2+ uptake regulation protein
MTTIDDILRRNSLSVTDSRKKILNLFLNVQGALAHGDIEKKAGEKFDRVTVYRTLQTFVEKGNYSYNSHYRQFSSLCLMQEQLFGRPSSR